jgi:triosephosphate isomerase
MRQIVIAGNWKMNKTLQEARDLTQELLSGLPRRSGVEVVLCPPFTALFIVRDLIKDSGVSLGAQNLHSEPSGAYTGEISAPMLKSAGCKYVIVGHSERRQYFFETDKLVNKKIRIALSFGLVPIFCIGERREDRERGLAKDVVATQLKLGLKSIEDRDIVNILIAYEPVWAIGTGLTATPSQVTEMHSFIRETIDNLYRRGLGEEVSVLYGGSVRPSNIDELMRESEIDGALVGGASLDPRSFSRICQFQL